MEFAGNIEENKNVFGKNDIWAVYKEKNTAVTWFGSEKKTATFDCVASDGTRTWFMSAQSAQRWCEAKIASLRLR